MLTQQELKSNFLYDHKSGVFINLKTNKLSGSFDKDGYVVIRVLKKIYKAHRLAFLYMTGSFPLNHVDHKDGLRGNNAWCNLREANMSENKQNNRKPRSDNSSGYLGVSFYKPYGKYQAGIKINGVRKQLGYFDTPEQSHKVYLKAKREIHPFCTI